MTRLFPEEVSDLIRPHRRQVALQFAIAGAIAVLEAVELLALFVLGSLLLGQDVATLRGAHLVTSYVEGYSQSQLTAVAGLVFAVVALLRTGIALAYRQIGYRWAGVVTARLQHDVMTRFALAPVSVFDGSRLGEIVHGAMEAPISAVLATESITRLMTSVFSLMMAAVALAYISPWLLLTCIGIVVPALLVVATPAHRSVRRLHHAVNERRAHATSVATNIIGAIRDIKAVLGEGRAVREFSQAVDDWARLQSRVWFVKLVPGQGLQMVIQVCFAASAVIIAIFVPADRVGGLLATLGVFGYSLFRFYPVLTQLSNAWLDMSAAVPGLRMAAAWTSLPEDNLARGIHEAPAGFDAIQLNKVSFAYDNGTPAVTGLNFRIEANKVTSLVGESGAGKSTVIDLILKFRAPQQGGIRLGETNLADVDRRSWLQSVGVVRQDVFLFAGTIRENLLAWKPDASEDELLLACRQSGAWQFIERLPEKLDAAIGDRGVTLSGGQRQRIAIARALLRNPKVLILDEAFSALDGEIEAQILQSLLVDSPLRTIILVSHRLTTVRRSDQIIVLDRGRVVEQGTHAQLLSMRGRYADLFATQMLEESAVSAPL